MPSLTNAVIVALLAVSTVVVAARLATAPHSSLTAPQSASLLEAPAPVPPVIRAPRAHRAGPSAAKCPERRDDVSRGRNGSADPACAKARELPPELPPRPDHTVAQGAPDLAAPGSREATQDEGESTVAPERLVVESPAPARPAWRPRIPDDADRFTVRHLRDVVSYFKSLEGAGSEP